VNVPVLQTSFTPEQDFIVVDMTEAYNAPFLTRYERTMRFSRQGPGAVDIVDNFQLKSPTVIDEALPTHGTWSVLDARTLEVTVQGQRLDVTVDSPYPITFASKQINDNGNPFTRVSFSVQMLTSGAITMHVAPR
jgi:hypothetical protein